VDNGLGDRLAQVDPMIVVRQFGDTALGDGSDHGGDPQIQC